MSFDLIKSPDGLPATVAEIAVIEFAFVKEFRSMTKAERLKRAHGIVDEMRPAAVIAGEILALEKPELVATVAGEPDKWGPLLKMLADARDAGQALAEVIGSAEARLAVALAVVEGEGG